MSSSGDIVDELEEMQTADGSLKLFSFASVICHAVGLKNFGD